jgi:hypothetical protein
MRNLLVVLGLMVICQFSFAQAQETNQNLLIKARTELEVAVKKEDYERAAELKKEIKLREQIESAVASEDFEEAARLKRLLVNSDSQIEESGENDPSMMSDYRFPKPEEGKAIIEFVKVTAQGWNAETMLFDGNEYIGSVWGVSHMRIEVDPGQHLFWMNITDKMGYLDANLEANKVYIVVIDMAATAFSNVGLSPVTMDNISLVDRAKRVIYKHPVKVTSIEDIAKKQAKLDKKGFIEKQLAKYQKKDKSSAKTHVLSSDMNIPLEYLQR